MGKKIVYIAVDNDIEGNEEDDILYASFNEDELKSLHNKDKSKNYRKLSEIIVDVDVARANALAKLDGVDRLILGLPSWIDEKEDNEPNKPLHGGGHIQW